jgi:gliding motility-associated protein GldL
MAKGKSFFESRAFKVTMGKVYGIGAAVVILGAMFKILHLPGANEMIGIGLSTEAVIFFISAFEPIHEEPDWTLVYPELAGMDPKTGKKENKNLVKTLDQMLEEAKIEQQTITRLGESMRGLTDNVNKLSTVGDAAMATNEYAKKATEAAGAMGKLNQSYSTAIEAIDKIGKSGDVSKAYYETVQSVTGKLASLNTIYEAELKESNNHIKQLNSFYGALSKAVENLSGAEQSTRQMKDEFGKLSGNLASLNNVYGNMLTAMAAGAAARGPVAGGKA